MLVYIDTYVEIKEYVVYSRSASYAKAGVEALPTIQSTQSTELKKFKFD
jgi:hypothetical protein